MRALYAPYDKYRIPTKNNFLLIRVFQPTMEINGNQICNLMNKKYLRHDYVCP